MTVPTLPTPCSRRGPAQTTTARFACTMTSADPVKACTSKTGSTSLGLPIIRTAPDHGTAFDIAGQDRADPRAMAAAMLVAAQSAIIALPFFG